MCLLDSSALSTPGTTTKPEMSERGQRELRPLLLISPSPSFVKASRKSPYCLSAGMGKGSSDVVSTVGRSRPGIFSGAAILRDGARGWRKAGRRWEESKRLRADSTADWYHSRGVERATESSTAGLGSREGDGNSGPTTAESTDSSLLFRSPRLLVIAIPHSHVGVYLRLLRSIRRRLSPSFIFSPHLSPARLIAPFLSFLPRSISTMGNQHIRQLKNNAAFPWYKDSGLKRLNMWIVGLQLESPLPLPLADSVPYYTTLSPPIACCHGRSGD
jgi:hypothetical protein